MPGSTSDGPPAGARREHLLDSMPKLSSMYARSVGPGSWGKARAVGVTLPDVSFRLAGVRPDRDRIASYDRVCGFTLRDEAPPTFGHLLTFPLQVAVLSDKSFPFPIAGMVHTGNSITQTRPIVADDRLTVQVYADRLEPHRRGTTVDMIAAITVDDEPIWRSTSTYLFPGREIGPAPSPDLKVLTDNDEESMRTIARWRVPADMGRRYAAVSGDVNPIHLSPVSARMFGFKSAIVHGMWTKARCVAALSGRVPAATRVSVEFRSALTLPSEVRLWAAESSGDGEFKLTSKNGEKTHLTGRVTALD